MLRRGLLWFGLVAGTVAIEPQYANKTSNAGTDFIVDVQKTPEHTCKEYAIEYCKKNPHTTTKTETCYVTVHPSPSYITVT